MPVSKPLLNAKLHLSLSLSILFTLSCQAQLFMPLDIMKVNSGFGPRIHPVVAKADFHRGIDLYARSAPIFCILSGVVTRTGFNPILGNFIRIDHGGMESIYGHLSIILVFEGEKLASGETIGISGSSGRVTGEHLHFAICYQSIFLDPILFFKKFYE